MVSTPALMKANLARHACKKRKLHTEDIIIKTATNVNINNGTIVINGEFSMSSGSGDGGEISCLF
ncbi:hypothetical protein PS15m_006419 [Mucor circinelloides]